MTTWGNKHTPHWPTDRVVKNAGWRNRTVWPDGPNLRSVMLDLLPVMRAFFLLGHRAREVWFLDFVGHGRDDHTSPAGWLGIDVATSEEFSIDHVHPPHHIIDSSAAFTDGERHIVFKLDELGDQSGYFNDLSESAPQEYRGYGIDLPATRRLLSFSTANVTDDNVATEVDNLLVALFDLLLPRWVSQTSDDQDQTPDQPTMPLLARVQNGGMLWIFDPAHWLQLSEENKAAFSVPNKMLQEALESSAQRRRFLFEQIYDIGMRGDQLPEPTQEAIAHVRGRRRFGGARPSLKYYFYPPKKGENELDLAYEGRLKNWKESVDFHRHLCSLVDRRGLSHIWTWERRQIYQGLMPEAWLDTILALAWEGAIEIPDAVRSRDAPAPTELIERRVTVNSGHDDLSWDLKVHGFHTITLTPTYVPAASTDQEGHFAGKFAYDYKPGTDKQPQPTLMIVASRGVEIEVMGAEQPTHPPSDPPDPPDDPLISSNDPPVLPGDPPIGTQKPVFKAHFDGFFKRYADKYAWRIEIFRLQDDDLVPALGANINPSNFLGPSNMVPSPWRDVETGEVVNGVIQKRRLPKVDLFFPYRTSSQSPVRVQFGVVSVKPHRYGVRIEYPILSDALASDIRHGLEDDEVHTVSVSNPGVIDISVNPFSGRAGFTFDLMLERFETDLTGDLRAGITNLHTVVVVSAERAVDAHGNTLGWDPRRLIEVDTTYHPNRSSFDRFVDVLANREHVVDGELDSSQPLHNSFIHGTAEVWKVRSGDMLDLPRPLEEKLPVSIPEVDAGDENLLSVGTMLAQPPISNRLTQSSRRMPTGSDLDADGWGLAPFGTRNIRVKHLDLGEWISSNWDNVLRMLVDLGVSQIPFFGDIVDLAELAVAMSTGHDRWGRPVTNLDLSLMVIGSALPIFSSATLKALRPADNQATAVTNLTIHDAPDLGDGIFFELNQPRGDSFFRRIAGLLKQLDDDPDNVADALLAEADTFLNLQAFNGSIKSVKNHNARVTQFRDELITNRARIIRRFGTMTDAEHGENYLTVADLMTEDGKGFIYSVFQTDYLAATARLRESTGNPEAVLDPGYFLRREARATTRAAAKAFIYDPNAVRRIPGRKVNAPTLGARAARGDTPVPPASISGDMIVNQAVKYLKEIVRGNGSVKMQGAGYGRDNLGDARQIFEDAGFGLPATADEVTENHAFVQLIKNLMGGDANDYPDRLDLLVGARKNPKKVTPEECGARVVEGLIMSVDQLRGNAEIAGVIGSTTLGNAAMATALKPKVRDAVGQWLYASQGTHEHFIKSELVESTAIWRRVSSAQDTGDEFHGMGLVTTVQSKLPKIEGDSVASGADDLLYITVAQGPPPIRVSADFQLKAYKSLDGAAGFRFSLDTNDVMIGRPPIVHKVKKTDRAGNVREEWEVKGGSAIFHQIVSQRLRQARYGGWSPPPGTTNFPSPSQLPRNPDGSLNEAALTAQGWVKSGTRHVYTIDTNQIMDSLASKLFMTVPAHKRKAVLPEDLVGLTPEERALMKDLFPEMYRPPPEPLNLHDGEAFYDAFEDNNEIIRQILMDYLNGYEGKVGGLDTALGEITGQAGPLTPHQIYIRFSSDGSLDDAIRFVAGTSDVP